MTTSCECCGFSADEGGWCGVCGADLRPGADFPRFSKAAQERSALWAADPAQAEREYTMRVGRAPVTAPPAPSGSAVPDRDEEPVIAALAEGEERLLQTVYRADGNRNEIYLLRRRPSDDAATGAGDPINFVAVIRYSDADSTDTSPPWAWQRGSTERSICIAVAEAIANAPLPVGASTAVHPDVQWFVDRIRETSGPSAMEIAAGWADAYAAACGEVLAAANACLEAANLSVGARQMAAQRPQHEISIRHFVDQAEEAERQFGSLYSSFQRACGTAREAAAELLAANPNMADVLLEMRFEEDVLRTVATVKAILGADYGPTPAGFVKGVDETNALIQNPRHEGSVYRPPAPERSDERTCPWCAETIKAAAIICRFCGRDIEALPNAG